MNIRTARGIILAGAALAALVLVASVIPSTDLRAQALTKQQQRELMRELSKYNASDISSLMDHATSAADSAGLSANCAREAGNVDANLDSLFHGRGLKLYLSQEGIVSIGSEEAKGLQRNLEGLPPNIFSGTITGEMGSGYRVHADGITLNSDSKKYFIKEVPVPSKIEPTTLHDRR